MNQANIDLQVKNAEKAYRKELDLAKEMMGGKPHPRDYRLRTPVEDTKAATLNPKPVVKSEPAHAEIKHTIPSFDEKGNPIDPVI
jgi:hypothetical protein